MTSSERKSLAIAKQLVKAIRQIEQFDDDPAMVLEDAIIQSNSDSVGVKDAILALNWHYTDR